VTRPVSPNVSLAEMNAAHRDGGAFRPGDAVFLTLCEGKDIPATVKQCVDHPLFGPLVDVIVAGLPRRLDAKRVRLARAAMPKPKKVRVRKAVTT